MPSTARSISTRSPATANADRGGQRDRPGSERRLLAELDLQGAVAGGDELADRLEVVALAVERTQMRVAVGVAAAGPGAGGPLRRLLVLGQAVAVGQLGVAVGLAGRQASLARSLFCARVALTS